jgi:cytochrome bd ubiquinol oxidase subunit I
VILYALVGTTTILVLRGMSRRFRRAGGFTDQDTPYGPSAVTEVSAQREEAVG